MDSRIIEALILLAVGSLGGVSTLIQFKVRQLAKELKNNTSISTEARDASNGRLSETLDRLAVERNMVIALRAIIHERDDRLAYIVARLPEAEALMTDYANRHKRHTTVADEKAVEQRVMGT